MLMLRKSVLKGEEAVHMYCKENFLKASILPFIQHERFISPLAQEFRLGVNHFLLGIGNELEEEIRTKLFNAVDFDYIRYDNLAERVAQKIELIYQRSTGQTVNIDMLKFKTILFSNIKTILEEIEGDSNG